MLAEAGKRLRFRHPLIRSALYEEMPTPVRAAWLADALYRTGDIASAGRLADQTLAHSVEPDLLTDLHWTLAQCRIYEGRFEESIATLDRALASPGIAARDRARLLVLAARTHSNFGVPDEAGRVAAEALAVAPEADDNWAMGWALLMMALVRSVGGRMTEALSLFDRALAVTRADPALADMRLLVLVNKAITLGTLDRHEEALSAAGQARELADQVGATVRLAQAHGALGQLLFQTGRWDEALAEVEVLPGYLKEPGAACCEIGIAAVIAFHRGDVLAARRHLAAAVPLAERLGRRRVGPLALARSLDLEQAGALPEALAELTDVCSDSPDDVEEVEDLLPDVVRLAAEAGDLEFARAGDREQAQGAAVGAAEIYTRLGAAVDVARVQARLLAGETPPTA